MKNEFIAYDKKNKRFIPSYQVAVNSEGDVYLCEDESKGYTRKVDNIEILKYSGKADKFGVPLYKGDIVKAKLPLCEDPYERKEDLKPKTIIGVVVIRPSEGARILVKKIVPEDPTGIKKGRTIRIKEDSDIRIGHVYTNPELLEEEVAK